MIGGLAALNDNNLTNRLEEAKRIWDTAFAKAVQSITEAQKELEKIRDELKGELHANSDSETKN
jgi:hypothetical protein